MKSPKANRAAVYARYSTDLQNELSIDDQISQARSYADREGLEVVSVFSDRAKTGATIIGRDGLLDLMDAARAGKFGAVIVESLDRLSRDQEELAGIFKRLEFAGVSILTLNEGAATNVHVGLRGLVGHLFLKDLGQKVRRHHSSRAKEGKIPGGVSYGYRLIPGKPGEREIDPDQAAVVRRIFEEYAAGKSPRAIAAGLNEDRIPSPTGGQWSGTALAGERRLMNNPLYAGRAVWNRARYVMDPDTGKKTRRKKETAEVISVDVPHLAIITPELWSRAHAVRKERAVQKFGPSGTCPKKSVPRKATLLSGLLRCEGCGAEMIIVARPKTDGASRVACHNATKGIGCDRRRTYSLPKLERTVLEGLKLRLADSRALAVFLDEWRKQEAEENRRALGEREGIRRRLTEIEANLLRLLRFLEAGTMAEDLIRSRMNALEAERVSLKDRESQIGEVSNVVELRPDAVRVFQDAVDSLLETIGNRELRPEAWHVVRSLIGHVIVKETEKRKPYEVALFGRIAGLVAPSREKPRTAEEIAAEIGAFFDNDGREVSRITLSKKIVFFGVYRENRLALTA